MFRVRAAFRRCLVIAAVAAVPVVGLQVAQAGAPAPAAGTAVAASGDSMVWD